MYRIGGWLFLGGGREGGAVYGQACVEMRKVRVGEGSTLYMAFFFLFEGGRRRMYGSATAGLLEGGWDYAGEVVKRLFGAFEERGGREQDGVAYVNTFS